MKTLTDIAELTGVSKSTVHRVIRNQSGVSDEVKNRVLDVVREVGYRRMDKVELYKNLNLNQSPAFVRQSSNKNAVKFVGVLTQTFYSSSFQIEYLAGMSQVSGELNVSQFVHNYTADRCADVLIPSLQPPVLREGMVSGLILVHRWPLNVVRELAKKFPCVSIVHDYTDAGVSYVGLDNYGAVSMLFEKLYALGHRKIGFLGACKDLTWSMARLGGYCQSMAHCGLEIEADNIVDVELGLLESKSYDWQEYFDFDRIYKLVDSGVTAWMCSSDWSAYNLFAALKQKGYDVPKDVSITGFDTNEKTHLGCSNVTSVSVDSEQLGRRALRLLCDLIDGRESGCCKIINKCEYFEGTTIQSPRIAALSC